VAVPPDEIQDPPARAASPDFPWWNRDQCRSPMPWTGGPGAGFTTGRPWMRLAPDTATRNVQRQLDDPDSILALYRRLLRARRASPALHGGDLTLLPTSTQGVLGYLRRAGESLALVVVNFGQAPVEATVEVGAGGRWEAVVSTHMEGPAPFRDGGVVALGPLEAAVFTPVGGY
jgi:alpha-glucosidase